MPKRSNEEHQTQVAIANYLATVTPPGSLWFAVPNGGNRDSITGAILRREGVRAGVADLVVLYEGRTLFLEVKTATGRLSKSQVRFRDLALSAGAEYAVVRSIDDVAQALIAFGVPILGRSVLGRPA